MTEWSLTVEFVSCYQPPVVFDRKEDFYSFSLASLLREQTVKVFMRLVGWCLLHFPLKVISPADSDRRSVRKEITTLHDFKLSFHPPSGDRKLCPMPARSQTSDGWVGNETDGRPLSRWWWDPDIYDGWSTAKRGRFQELPAHVGSASGGGGGGEANPLVDIGPAAQSRRERKRLLHLLIFHACFFHAFYYR